MSSSEATVFIVDDDPVVRDALTLMIEQDGLAVKAFESGEAFFAAHQPECCGCAIIDVHMPGMDGMQVQEKFSSGEILLPIIFLTGHGTIPMGVKAIKAGAVDFLTKPVTKEKLLSTVRSAIRISEGLLAQVAISRIAKSRLANLTEREMEVMAMAVLGKSNKEIARNLGISHRTVEIHKSKIMQKTGAINLLDLASIAHDGGAMVGKS